MRRGWYFSMLSDAGRTAFIEPLPTLQERARELAMASARERENELKRWHGVIMQVQCCSAPGIGLTTRVLSVTLGPRRDEPYTDGRYHVRVRIRGVHTNRGTSDHERAQAD